MGQHGLVRPPALGGIGVGQDAPKRPRRIHGPADARADHQEKAAEEELHLARGKRGQVHPSQKQHDAEQQRKEAHLRPQQRRDAGAEAAEQVPLRRHRLLFGTARDGDQPPAHQAPGRERFHSGVGPIAEVWIDDQHQHHGGREDAAGRKTQAADKPARKPKHAGEREDGGQRGEGLPCRHPAGHHRMNSHQQPHPERRSITVNHVPVEGEALPTSEGSGKLQVDPGVVLPVVQRVGKPEGGPTGSKPQKQQRGRWKTLLVDSVSRCGLHATPEG